MKNKIFFIIILFLFKLYLVRTDYAIFELNTYKNNSLNADEYINYFYNKFSNIIYSKIPLGPNKENFIMEIRTNTRGFTIFNHNCDIPPADNSHTDSYLPTLGDSTIIDTIDDNQTTIFEEYFISILENTIYINTDKGPKSALIDFVFSPRNNSNYTKKLILRPYTCFTLGFLLTYINNIENIETVDDFSLNLIFQFKKQKLISSYNWFIEYDSQNNDKGKIILGAKPHEYNIDKYKEENEKVMNAPKRDDNKIYWDIIVNEIYVGKNKKYPIEQNYRCSLEPSLGVIIGSDGYKNFIYKYLFHKLIDEGKCFESNDILDKYIIFYCKKEIKQYLKDSDFNNISFLHRYFGKIFELNYDDLFEEVGNYIYFKVFFSTKDYQMWIFGKPFLKKYLFSYNLDGRTISFYDNEQEENKNEKSKMIVIIIVIIILLIICSVLGFILGKIYYENKKKKSATELLEDDDNNDSNIESINNGE